MSKVTFSQTFSAGVFCDQPYTLRAIADDKFYQMSDHYGEFTVSKIESTATVEFTFNKPLPGVNYAIQVLRSDNNESVFNKWAKPPLSNFNFDAACDFKCFCTVHFPAAVEVSKCALLKDFTDTCKKNPDLMMTFKVGDEEIKAVTALMMSRSPVIKAMMESDCIEAKTKTVKIDDFSIDVVKGFVQFCETNGGRFSQRFKLDLYKIADKYDVEPMRKSFSGSIMINGQNVIQMFGFARTYQCLELEKRCIEFGVAHFMEIHESAVISEIDSDVLMDFWAVSSEYRSVTKNAPVGVGVSTPKPIVR